MKNYVTLFIFILIFIPAARGASVGKLYFEQLNTTHGLSQNTVYTILQDQTGFMWFGTKDGLNRYDGHTFRHYKKDFNHPNSLGNSFVTTLYQDKDGIIWVGTDAGIWLYDPLKDSFSYFDHTTTQGNKIDKTIVSIKSDDSGKIWILSNMPGLCCYDPETNVVEQFLFAGIEGHIRNFMIQPSGSFWLSTHREGLYYSTDNLQTIHLFTLPDGSDPFRDDVISCMHPGTYNRIYLSSEKEGMKEIDTLTGRVRQLTIFPEKKEQLFVRDFIMSTDQELWIGTESGLFIYNTETENVRHMTSSHYDSYAISDNAIYCVYKDREEGTWIGTYFGGLNYVPYQFTPFEKFYPTNHSTDIQGKRVREIIKGADSRLWVGTEDNGLYQFEPATGTFSIFEPSRNFTNVHALCMIGTNLWAGTFQKGIQVISPDGKLIKTYKHTDDPNSLADNSVFTILKTKSGDIFVGTLTGLQVYNPEDDNFIDIEEVKGNFIYDILEDTSGNIWLATYVHGVYKLDRKQQKWIHYSYDAAEECGIPSNKISAIYEDRRRQIWIATQGGGFCRYLPETDRFEVFNSGNGLPFDVVYQIIEDDDAYFWITTNSGLVRLNTQDMTYVLYTEKDGLLNNQFSYKSAYKDEKGAIYMGNQEGMIRFDYPTFRQNPYVPPVVLTEFMIFNQPVPIGEPGSPLTQSITYSEAIVLKAGQHSFSFSTAMLSYQASRFNQLVYKLEGLDKEWNHLTGNQFITYSNLRHGDYTLYIQTFDKNSTPSVLHIRILPPFYLSLWAYIIYFILFWSLITGFIYWVTRRNRIRHLRQMELFNQERERELYKSKIEFFTHVAHEIRTPLTLIKSPLDHILARPDVSDDIQQDLKIMNKNTERLLNLTNQLLDFRKTEISGFRLNFEDCNVSGLLHETFMRFKPLMNKRRLDFTLEVPEEDLFAHVDIEGLTKILSNLFNNAAKYGQSFVKITLEHHSDQGIFMISVVNDGMVVPLDKREEIFQPFVRIEEDRRAEATTGTGIGLALARSLAELHNGTLRMDETAQINRFILSLPVVHEQALLLRQEEPASGEVKYPEIEDTIHIDEGRLSILIAEDNPEMQAFVVRLLKENYNVLTAPNGQVALDLLEVHEVHLVVSDIVMPLMDGYQFCRMMKSDIRYTHIPLILLTAKTNVQARIEGMEAGADAYIDKPFSNDYLLVCIANLLQSRSHLRNAFTHSPVLKAGTIAMNKQDEDFLTQIAGIIHENMKNPDYSIDDMADTFHMSRSSFYRKIKGLTGMSPNEFLRLERLKKAAYLLKEDGAFVNEVCYMVGFNSPSYFSKCFYKQFGILPKDY